MNIDLKRFYLSRLVQTKAMGAEKLLKLIEVA